MLGSGILARRLRLFNRLRKTSGRGTRRTCKTATEPMDFERKSGLA